MENSIKSKNYIENPDVTSITIGSKKFIIVGTAHVSQKSTDLVREVIEGEQPNSVCVELDEQRFSALSNKKKWEELDLKSIIRNKQLTTLFVNLVLSSYQKKLGKKLGVMPGTELLEATKVAKENDIPVELVDRDVKITLRRAWNKMSFFQKLKFMSAGLVGVLEKKELTEEDLEKLKEKDVLTELMNDLGRVMPVLKEVLIDERDTYISEKMRKAKGEKIVSVVGAGHVTGIVNKLKKNESVDLKQFEVIPPVSPYWKWLGWSIPAIIVFSLIYIGYSKGMATAQYNVMFWILANGIPSAIGGIIALAHPATIISVFLAAPLTSLSPLIGAGYVAAFVQAYFRPPVVKEFETLSEDFNHIRMWWKNKLLKIFLVFILTGIGSALGTYVGAYQVISELF